MTDPVVFTNRTNRFGLPYLFPGQAQKELFINEAYALLDALLHPVVEGFASSPPPEPVDGSCWIVKEDASGSWTGHSGQIACFAGGSWLFANPPEGMRVYDRSGGTDIRFRNGWQSPPSIAHPSGGAVIDAEARMAITDLIEVLEQLELVRQTS